MKSLITEKGFQQGHLLTVKNSDYRNWILSFLNLQLSGDKRERDLTQTAIFSDSNETMKGEIISQEDGIMAGLEELSLLCESQGIALSSNAVDGMPIRAGKKVAEIVGPIRRLLETERTALDLIARMSGIATETHRLVSRVTETTQTFIAATRKTLWGALDKKAVFLGGGLTHRLGLWQAILVKENHLMGLRNQGAADPFEEAIKRSMPFIENGDPAFFEIEVESCQDASRAGELLWKNFFPVSRFAPQRDLPIAILLDNFPLVEILETVRHFHQKGWNGKIILEASGGINSENALDFAATGVNILSLGSLTHSAKSFNFSQRLVP